MTREEREKAIDALKISAPVTAVTQEEFNDYIQTLNKIMDWLEQEPCTDAISRAEVLSHTKTEWGNGHEQPFDYIEVDVIKQLPPATPSYNSIKTELEPCTDAISRQDAIDALTKTSGIRGDTLKALYDLPPVTPQYTDAEIQKMQDLEFAEIQKAYEIGKAEGSSEKPNKWIPVSVRLPEKGGDYLTTISFDIGAGEPVREVYKDFFCVLSQKWFYHNEDVMAWMPLPKPFEGNTK